MAYFVSANKRFLEEAQRALEKYFGDQAKIFLDSDNLSIKVKVLSGFDEEVKRLLPEQIKKRVMGGGLKQGLNGREFILKLDMEIT